MTGGAFGSLFAQFFLLRRSILTEKVALCGHHVMREYIVDPFETMRVADITAQPVDTLPDWMSVKEAVSFFTAPDAPPGTTLSSRR